MSTRTALAAAVLALGLTAGQAFAEGEGNGDPFPFQAAPQVATGRAFVADTGSAQYPQPTGNSAQPSSLAALEPAFGSEAPVQTANSLPRRSGDGTVAYAQAQSIGRHFAARARHERSLEAGVTRPLS